MEHGSNGCLASPASLKGCGMGSMTVATAMAPRRRSVVCPPKCNLSGYAWKGSNHPPATDMPAVYESNRVTPTRSRAGCDAGATIAALSPLPRPAPPGKITAGPLSSPFVRLSSYNERGRNRSRSVTALDGLTPAPRRMATKAGAMAETPRSARSRVRLFGEPSSLTFGSYNSTGSRGFVNSSSESYEVVDAGQFSTIDLGGLSRECTRPDTPGSSRTFGKAGIGKRPKT